MKLTQSEATVAQAAAKAGMDEKTARKYRRVKQVPSQIRKPHEWRTRADVFEPVWGEIEEILGAHPTVQAKTMFEHRAGNIRVDSSKASCARCNGGSSSGVCTRARNGK